jgi:hypothetical protein
MTLLAPAAAALAAAIALPALVVLYLLKLRRRPVRVSTAMFWQRAERDVQANVPLRWIRPSALFVLHVLILAMLVLALGRPALRTGGVARERVVLLMDCSASMSARDMAGGMTRLAAAKARAGEIINELSRSGASASVVSFARETKVLSPMTTSRRVLLEAVASVEGTDQPGDLEAALSLVESIARAGAGEGDESSVAATVMVLSDGGFRTTDGLRARGLRVRLEHVGPTPAGEADAMERAAHANAGIVVMAARRDAEDPTTVRLFARVINARSEAASVPVTLSLDGRVVERRGVTIPAREGAGLGELPLSFEFLAPRGGVAMLSLGREDVLAADNDAALVLSPPASPAILLAHRHSEPGDTKRAAREAALALTRDALDELRPRTLRVVDERQLVAIFGSGEWRAYDLFVGLDVVPPANVGMASLTFGATPEWGGLRVEEAMEPGGGTLDVMQWERQHPLLRSVALDALIVSRAKRLRVEEAGVEGGAWTILARGREGPLMALHEDGGLRRVAVAFALEDSNWALQIGFPLFLANAVEYLTLRGESSIGKAYTTGEAVEIEAEGMGGRGRVTLEGPVRVEVDATRAVGGRLSVGALTRAGVYVARGLVGVVPIAVNLSDGMESSLLERATLRVGSVEEMAAAGSSPREIWAWFVLVALGLLAMEWVVYGLQMRV